MIQNATETSIGVIDALLREAEQTLTALRAERLRIEQLERFANERVAHLRALVDLDAKAESAFEVATASAAAASDLPLSFEDAAAEILSETGALHYRDLYTRCAQRLGGIASKKPHGVLLTRITRDSRFCRASKRGWYELASASPAKMASAAQTRKRRKRKRRSKKT